MGGFAENTTNNRMELKAVMEALRQAQELHNVLIVMDSEYVRRGITEWIQGWKARGWLTKGGKAVSNRDLWEELDLLKKDRVRFTYTAGHSGDPDNERVDRIAHSFSQGRPVELITDGFDDTPFSPLQRHVGHKGSSSKKGPAVYLSYVNRKLMRHATWAECEKEVKGRSGALYKKCRSEAEERETLVKWGLHPEMLP
jgi:ribonuclease HI